MEWVLRLYRTNHRPTAGRRGRFHQGNQSAGPQLGGPVRGEMATAGGNTKKEFSGQSSV